MEQRTYQGNVSAQGLAAYLVNTFNTGAYTVAQQVGQGDHLLVQIGHGRHVGLRGVRHAIGVSIVRTPDGLTVGVGQSNWMNLSDPALGGTLIGAIFFPPLLVFPLLRGIRNLALYQDIWNAIDGYCLQAGATQGGTTVAHGIQCPRCGVMNHEEARYCTTCGAALQEQPAPVAAEYVTCSECHHRVSAGRYCSNCGAALSGATGSA